MSEQAILQEAYEQEQARPFTRDEAGAWVWVAVILGISFGAPTGVLAGACIALFKDYNLLLCVGIGAGAGYLLMYGAIVLRGMWPQFRRLWAEREATTYAAPQLEAPIQSGPPIVVKPYKGDPYILGRDGEPLALPDGRESGLALNEPTIAAIIKEVLTHHDGNWSRKRLMGIKIQGHRITRALYEDLTAKLANAGFLQERPIGGYKLPDDIQQFDDLGAYFPNLESRKEGGKVGRKEKSGLEAGSSSGGVVTNLAERHRLSRMADLDHSVRCYLERKDDHD